MSSLSIRKSGKKSSSRKNQGDKQARCMVDQGAGVIINVASLAGRSSIILGGALYTSAKRAMIGLSSHIAKELSPKGLRINAFCPGDPDPYDHEFDSCRGDRSSGVDHSQEKLDHLRRADGGDRVSHLRRGDQYHRRLYQRQCVIFNGVIGGPVYSSD